MRKRELYAENEALKKEVAKLTGTMEKFPRFFDAMISSLNRMTTGNLSHEKNGLAGQIQNSKSVMSDKTEAPDGLRILADWFDTKYPNDQRDGTDQVQQDLRRWATENDALKAEVADQKNIIVALQTSVASSASAGRHYEPRRMCPQCEEVELEAWAGWMRCPECRYRDTTRPLTMVAEKRRLEKETTP